MIPAAVGWAGRILLPHPHKALFVERNLNAMKIQTLLILTFILFSFCHGQKLKHIYYAVSSDSLHSGHQLIFTSDTSLEISPFPRHMSAQFTKPFMYKRIENKIEVYNNRALSTDSIALTNYGLTQFINQVTFIIDKRAIMDSASKIVYVLYRDFSKRYYLTYIIDGEVYKQEKGFPDAYGIIKNDPKENKALKHKLASLKDKIGNYTVNVYKGLEAYKLLGYDSVFGVIVLKKKE